MKNFTQWLNETQQRRFLDPSSATGHVGSPVTNLTAASRGNDTIANRRNKTVLDPASATGDVGSPITDATMQSRIAEFSKLVQMLGIKSPTVKMFYQKHMHEPIMLRAMQDIVSKARQQYPFEN